MQEEEEEEEGEEEEEKEENIDVELFRPTRPSEDKSSSYDCTHAAKRSKKKPNGLR